MSFDFNIALTGIGPHSNTKLSSNMNSIQMALYADNGSGKSFISKSFKRISDLKYLDRTDQPIHTIPNQIRHVLETTYRFEGSCDSFDDYILNNEILGKNGCLYSLIEDHSHGGLRTSKGYTDNMLIDSCRMVVDFIASKYPGQIEEAKRLSAQ